MVGRTSLSAKKRSAKQREAEAALTKGNMQVRVVSLAAVVALFFVLLATRLWYLQVLTGQDYSLAAQATRTRDAEIPAPRGVIHDRNGAVLATNGPGLNVTVVPASISRDKVEKLAGILGADKKAVLASYDAAIDPQTGNRYAPMLVKENADRNDVTYLSERTEEFPGVVVNDDYVRSYPQGETAAHVLGYTGAVTEQELNSYSGEGLSEDSVVGKSGVELAYEKALSGTPGRKEYNVDALGRVVPEGSQLDAMGRFVDKNGNVSDGVAPREQVPSRVTDPIPGDNLTLTLDLGLQKTAEAELDAAIKRAKQEGSEGTGGAVVAIDPRNGEILAMASRPAFDPQLFVGGISGAKETQTYKRLSEAPNSPFTNRAISGSYPGASTFKVFTGLAGFFYGVINASTTYTDPGGCWRPRGVTDGCWLSWQQTYNGMNASHGTEDYAQAIADSNDKFFYQVADWLWNSTDNADLLPRFYERFGFGSLTGIDLPGETAGRVPTKEWFDSYQKQFYKPQDRRPWGIADWVNMAIGQGDVLVSPIQMAQAYSAVQNGGTLVTPHVGKEITTQSGKLVKDISPKPEGRVVIGPAARNEMLRGLRGVTGPTGTAAPAFEGSPLSVLGKSGTGEMEPHDPVNWFAGWAQNQDNPLVVVVMVEGGGHSEVTAAPAVRNILEHYYGVEDGSRNPLTDASSGAAAAAQRSVQTAN